MRERHGWLCLAVGLWGLTAIAGDELELSPPEAEHVTLSPIERLGKRLFFDERLSEPQGQSCAACHAASTGWTGPDEPINVAGAVYEGAVSERFGNRKPPSSAYATPSPVFQRTRPGGDEFMGGSFWDGRATGEESGNPAVDQAKGPFLNPVEQNNPSPAVVVHKVCTGPYASLFLNVFGEICGNVDAAYDAIAQAIAAYEASKEVSAFSSKYDAYLAGRASLTAQEKKGLRLFTGKAKCDRCHPVQPGRRGEPPLFTDFTYDNIGMPRNPFNPWYEQQEFNPLGAAWVDPGLGGFLVERSEYVTAARANLGKFKVPTLRNVDKRPSPGFVKAYGHNGYFKSLEAIVHFYNTRDVLPLCPPNVLPPAGGTPGVDCWPQPEQGLNVNTRELGDLGLSAAEEAAIVGFLRTLSDGYFKP